MQELRTRSAVVPTVAASAGSHNGASIKSANKKNAQQRRIMMNNDNQQANNRGIDHFSSYQGHNAVDRDTDGHDDGDGSQDSDRGQREGKTSVNIESHHDDDIADHNYSARSSSTLSLKTTILILLSVFLPPSIAHKMLKIPRFTRRQRGQVVTKKCLREATVGAFIILILLFLVAGVRLSNKISLERKRKAEGGDDDEDSDETRSLRHRGLEAEAEALLARQRRAAAAEEEEEEASSSQIDTDADVETVAALAKIAERLERQCNGLDLFGGSAFAFSQFRLSRVADRVALRQQQQQRQRQGNENLLLPLDDISPRQQEMFLISDEMSLIDSHRVLSQDEEQTYFRLKQYMDARLAELTPSNPTSYQVGLLENENEKSSSSNNNNNNKNNDMSTRGSSSLSSAIDPIFSVSAFEHNNAIAAAREGNFALSDFDDFTTEELLAATVLFRAEALASLANGMELARLKALRRRGLHADNRNLLKGKAAADFQKRSQLIASSASSSSFSSSAVSIKNSSNSNRNSLEDAISVNNNRHRGTSAVVPLRACFLTLVSHASRPQRDRDGFVNGDGGGGGGKGGRSGDPLLQGGGLANLHRLLVNVRQTVPLMASRYPFIIFHENTDVISSEYLGRVLLEKEMSFNDNGFEAIANQPRRGRRSLDSGSSSSGDSSTSSSIGDAANSPNYFHMSLSSSPATAMYTYGGAVNFEPIPVGLNLKRRGGGEGQQQQPPLHNSLRRELQQNDGNGNGNDMDAHNQEAGRKRRDQLVLDERAAQEARGREAAAAEGEREKEGRNNNKGGGSDGGDNNNFNVILNDAEQRKLGRRVHQDVEEQQKNDVERLAEKMLPIVGERQKVPKGGDEWVALKQQVLREARARLDQIEQQKKQNNNGGSGGGGGVADHLNDNYAFRDHNVVDDMIDLLKHHEDGGGGEGGGREGGANSIVDGHNKPIQQLLRIDGKLISRVEREGARGEMLAALSRFVFPRTISNPYSEDCAVPLNLNGGEQSRLKLMFEEEARNRQQAEEEARERKINNNDPDAPPAIKSDFNDDEFGISSSRSRTQSSSATSLPYEVTSAYGNRLIAEMDVPTEGLMYILNDPNRRGQEEEEDHANHPNDDGEDVKKNGGGENVKEGAAKRKLVEKQRIAYKAVLELEKERGAGAINSDEYAARLKALEDASNVKHVANKPAWKIREEKKLAAEKERKQFLEEAQQRNEMEKLLQMQKSLDFGRAQWNRKDEKVRDEEVVGDRGAEVEHRIRPGIFFEPVPYSDFGAIPPWIHQEREWEVPVNGVRGGKSNNNNNGNVMGGRGGLAGSNAAANGLSTNANTGIGFRHMSRFFAIRIFATKFFGGGSVAGGSNKNPNNNNAAADDEQVSARMFDYFFRLDTDAYILSTPLYSHLDAVLERKTFRWERVDIVKGKPIYKMKSTLHRSGHYSLQERDLFLAMAESRLQLGFSSVDVTSGADSLFTAGLLDTYDRFLAEENQFENSLQQQQWAQHHQNKEQQQRDDDKSKRSEYEQNERYVAGRLFDHVGSVHPLSDITSTVASRSLFSHWTSFTEIVNLNAVRTIHLHIPTQTSDIIANAKDGGVTALFNEKAWSSIRAAGMPSSRKKNQKNGNNPMLVGPNNKGTSYYNARIEELRSAHANIEEAILREAHKMDSDIAIELEKLKEEYLTVDNSPDEDGDEKSKKKDGDKNEKGNDDEKKNAKKKEKRRHVSAKDLAAFNAQYKALLILRAKRLQSQIVERRKIQAELQEELEVQKRTETHQREQELVVGIRVPLPEEARLMLVKGLFSSTLGTNQLPEFPSASSSTSHQQAITPMANGNNNDANSPNNIAIDNDKHLVVIDEETELESHMSVVDAIKAYQYQLDASFSNDNNNNADDGDQKEEDKKNNNDEDKKKKKKKKKKYRRKITALSLKHFLDDKIRFILQHKHYAKARRVARARALRQLLLLDVHSPLLALVLNDYIHLLKQQTTQHNLRVTMGNRYLETIDKHGGIYYNRWSDSHVRTTHFSLIAEPSEIAQLDTISMQHRESYHCHQVDASLEERNSYAYLAAGLGSREGLVYNTKQEAADSGEGLSSAKNRALHRALDGITRSPALLSLLSSTQSEGGNHPNNFINAVAADGGTPNRLAVSIALPRTSTNEIPFVLMHQFFGSPDWFRQSYAFSPDKSQEEGVRGGGGGEPLIPLPKILRMLEETLLPEAPVDWGFADYTSKENSISHMDLPLIGTVLQQLRTAAGKNSNNKISGKSDNAVDGNRKPNFRNINNDPNDPNGQRPIDFNELKELANEAAEEAQKKIREGRDINDDRSGWAPALMADLFESVSLTRGIQMLGTFNGKLLEENLMLEQHQKQVNVGKQQDDLNLKRGEGTTTTTAAAALPATRVNKEETPLIIRRLNRIREAIRLRVPPHSLTSDHSKASTLSCHKKAKRRFDVVGGAGKPYGTKAFDPSESPLLDDEMRRTGKECGAGWPRV